MTIEENILKIRQRVVLACSRANRDPGGVAIVAVSKGRSTAEIRAAITSGITDIGENRVQEAALKYKELAGAQIKWHLVGHLQTNKARDAVKMFDLIHSVDSLRLAEEINRQANKQNKVQAVLFQVNTSAEKSKFGLGPDEAEAVLSQAAALKNINIAGLMTIAPLSDDPQLVRPYFRRLRQLRDRINPAGVLSMGMTDDFEVAIEEGADLVRLGRAVFEG